MINRETSSLHWPDTRHYYNLPSARRYWQAEAPDLSDSSSIDYNGNLARQVSFKVFYDIRSPCFQARDRDISVRAGMVFTSPGLRSHCDSMVTSPALELSRDNATISPPGSHRIRLRCKTADSDRKGSKRFDRIFFIMKEPRTEPRWNSLREDVPVD